MIHSGSRGLGHQVATDALTSMERAMARDGIQTNDRQLACARIGAQVRACARLASFRCAVRLSMSPICLALQSSAHRQGPFMHGVLDANGGLLKRLPCSIQLRGFCHPCACQACLHALPKCCGCRKERITWQLCRARPTTPGSIAHP